MAVTSAGPHTNHLHLSPYRYNHASTSSLNHLQVRCSSRHPTNSVTALKAIQSTVSNIISCMVLYPGRKHAKIQISKGRKR